MIEQRFVNNLTLEPRCLDTRLYSVIQTTYKVSSMKYENIRNTKYEKIQVTLVTKLPHQKVSIWWFEWDNLCCLTLSLTSYNCLRCVRYLNTLNLDSPQLNGKGNVI